MDNREKSKAKSMTAIKEHEILTGHQLDRKNFKIISINKTGKYLNRKILEALWIINVKPALNHQIFLELKLF